MSKTRSAIIVGLTISLILIIFLAEIFNQNAVLRQTNQELSQKLQDTTRELKTLKENYTNIIEFVGANSKGEITPQIETRLGIKLMDGISSRNYLWVTGEVENIGNLTLFNVRLRFTMQTNNGTDVKEDIIGTLQAHQVVTRRFSAYSSIGNIMSWNLEPAATYEP